MPIPHAKLSAAASRTCLRLWAARVMLLFRLHVLLRATEHFTVRGTPPFFSGRMMPNPIMIPLDETVGEGLNRTISQPRISPFEEGYRAMAADEAREKAAQEWCHALANESAA